MSIETLKELRDRGVDRKNIFLDIAFTLLTFGLFNLYVQFRQIEDVNEILGSEDFSFIKVILLSIITFGLYFCYHEYLLTRELHKLLKKESEEFAGVMSAIAAFFGLWFVVDSFQQSLINEYLDSLDGIY